MKDIMELSDARDIRKNVFSTALKRYKGHDPDEMYWAAKDHKVARTYADPHRAWDYQGAEPATLPVQLRMKNPKVINWEGKKFRGRHPDGQGFNIHDHINQARKDGHDGVIIHRVIDSYNATGKPSTIYAVFHPDNIRIKK